MKNSVLLLAVILLLGAFGSGIIAQTTEREKIRAVLDQWHRSAAQADAKSYFDTMTEDAIYVGTDATEHWNKKDFQAFAKPFFDRGKAWDFRPLERHIYLSQDQKTAWFDELLDTWMKVCRGSGVLVKKGKEWKIKHYVLSMTVPNDVTNDAIKLKSPLEGPLIEKLQSK